jgi:hypothetical protein
MAEIQVERTKKSSATAWAIILVVLVAVLGAGWYFTMGPGVTPDLPGAEQAPGTAPTPGSGAEGAPAPTPPAPR